MSLQSLYFQMPTLAQCNLLLVISCISNDYAITCGILSLRNNVTIEIIVHGYQLITSRQS